MTLYSLNDRSPCVYENAWIAPDANIIGNVILRAKSSVWFCATLRGDNEVIDIGAGTNVQESTVMHTDLGYPLTIGENCTIGHKVMLHGCKIGNNTLIGMGAIVLNGATIGDNCLIGAGALITEEKIIPGGSLVIGSPGKIIRQLDAKAIKGLRNSALHYQENAKRFSNELKEV
ncbi:MAG: gamma carbonic anhydrase family protein [Aestuariivita sp.]|nr:gamma carbonic anhydrase family protein [Aestuariivita sp.]|tara:strand:- start:1666 stop:2187 length:522 start_codon:yes stop_codon:yes gene_type:complete